MRSIISVLFVAGIIFVMQFDLAVGVRIIPTTASSVITTTTTRIGRIITTVDLLLDNSHQENWNLILINRIRRGGDIDDLDSSNTVLDDDKDNDDGDDDDDSDTNIDRHDVIDDDDAVSPSVIFEGSFKDALLYAKQQGRLLIAFIPQKPQPISSSHSSTNSNDASATSIDHALMTSFTSTKVAKAAQQAPPKSKQIQQTNKNAGSFVLWYCSGGITSSEATALLKRIQGGTIQYKNASGQKRPILMALYPHTTTTTSLIIPRLYTQHHCSPPPTATKFVEWLQTIRKKNKKYYYRIQKQIQEYQWEQERKHGYLSSIHLDIEMKQREIKQELERQRLVLLEKEKNEQIQQRRIQLLESLDQVTVKTSTPPTTTTPTTTIALRFMDGRTTISSTDNNKEQQLQRTFNEHACIRDVFHWIDAVHEIPYETITLQTMNGKRTFVYDDRNKETESDANNGSDENNLYVRLHESGLGKMIGLRVIIKKS